MKTSSRPTTQSPLTKATLSANDGWKIPSYESIQTPKLIKKETLHHQVYDICYTSCGRRLLTVEGDTLYMRDAYNNIGHIFRKLPLEQLPYVQTLNLISNYTKFSKSGSRLACVMSRPTDFCGKQHQEESVNAAHNRVIGIFDSSGKSSGKTCKEIFETSTRFQGVARSSICISPKDEDEFCAVVSIADQLQLQVYKIENYYLSHEGNSYSQSATATNLGAAQSEFKNHTPRFSIDLENHDTTEMLCNYNHDGSLIALSNFLGQTVVIIDTQAGVELRKIAAPSARIEDVKFLSRGSSGGSKRKSSSSSQLIISNHSTMFKGITICTTNESCKTVSGSSNKILISGNPGKICVSKDEALVLVEICSSSGYWGNYSAPKIEIYHIESAAKLSPGMFFGSDGTRRCNGLHFHPSSCMFASVSDDEQKATISIFALPSWKWNSRKIIFLIQKQSHDEKWRKCFDSFNIIVNTNTYLPVIY